MDETVGLEVEPMRVAVFGIGLMGRPMAERLAQGGHEVTAYNRTASRAETLTDQGVRVVATSREGLEASDFVVLTLSDGAAIRDVLLANGSREALAGRTIIQMGTIGPAESRALQGEVEAAGGEYLEAPVLGSIPEARTGKLIVMVGASPEQFERCKDLLSVFGPEPRLIGPVGHAAGVKLALNQLIASLTSAFALSIGLLHKEAIPVDTFMDILRESALYAPTFDKKLGRMLKHQYDGPNFPTKHLSKDVGLFLAQAESLGLDSRMLEGVRGQIEETMARGLGDMDYSAIYEAVYAPAGRTRT
jgi:3-hydroxyisobutyrate dehydrogenase